MRFLRSVLFLGAMNISDAFAVTTAQHPHGGGSSAQMLLLPVLLAVVFYFLLIRPQSKRAKQQREMIDRIAVGDEVVTAGGILGKVKRLRDNHVVVAVAKNVEITLQKSSVASVLPKGTVEMFD